MGQIDSFTMMRLELQSNKRAFFFSQKQKEDQKENLSNPLRLDLPFASCDFKPRYALLDNGRIEEYTECHSLSLLDFTFERLKPHEIRYKDSVYLGTGEFADIDGFIKTLEKQLKEDDKV